MDLSSVSRGSFLIGSSSVAVTANASATPDPTPPPILPRAQIVHIKALYASVPFAFDRERFKAITGTSRPHRQVTVATSYQAAVDAVGRMRRTINVYADPAGFAAGPNAVSVAAVLYGSVSYAISLNDRMFEKYPIALAIDGNMHPGDERFRNAFVHVKNNVDADDYNALVSEHGAMFFVCNNALTGFCAELAIAMTPGGAPAVTRDRVVAIHDDLVQNFLPGTLLVPAGVAALCAIQEAGFTFLPEG